MRPCASIVRSASSASARLCASTASSRSPTAGRARAVHAIPSGSPRPSVPASTRSSSIVSMKRRSALIAAAAQAGDALGGRRPRPKPTRQPSAECATIRDSEVCPRPRLGELATRVKLTTSNGLASNDR